MDSAEQYLHDISGTRVVFTDNRNDNLDIYMVELIEGGDVVDLDAIHDAVDEFLADGSIRNRGIACALHRRLDRIGRAIDRGHYERACRRLERFIRFVSRKSGRQIDPAAADVLIGMAEELVGEYCGG